jgi:queuine tRNA-ribosyltransferase/7-cyano-7-deazaguanine tRNA-ribosyltransferase
MIKFRIIKKSKKSKARVGVLETEHGEIETPTLVPVATQAVVKTLDSKEVLETKTQILICNTIYLHFRPGEEVINKAGGLHNFMNWEKPLMTDSGGFQVFSWGFGMEYQTGKFFKKDLKSEIRWGQQPKLLKIQENGVIFTSLLDGSKVFFGPKESIEIQEKLGADIIFAFDECTPPNATYDYMKNSLSRIHFWEKKSFEFKKSKQALFGIIHGGRFKDLRIQSSKFIGSLPFDGFGIGGDLGRDKIEMIKILRWSLTHLPEHKPRHLLGIGYLEDIPRIIKEGIDLFDCNVPTHYARRGIAFTSEGVIDLEKRKERNPLDKNCSCFVCQNYRRDYISHLYKAKEITALKLLTFHNLYFFNSFVEKIREEIKNGKF